MHVTSCISYEVTVIIFLSSWLMTFNLSSTLYYYIICLHFTMNWHGKAVSRSASGT